MKLFVLLLGCLPLMFARRRAGELFRRQDGSGKIYYGDTPPANAVDVQNINSSGGTLSQDNDLPYESRIAQQNFPVTLYVGSDSDAGTAYRRTAC